MEPTTPSRVSFDRLTVEPPSDDEDEAAYEISAEYTLAEDFDDPADDYADPEALYVQSTDGAIQPQRPVISGSVNRVTKLSREFSGYAYMPDEASASTAATGAYFDELPATPLPPPPSAKSSPKIKVTHSDSIGDLSPSSSSSLGSSTTLPIPSPKSKRSDLSQVSPAARDWNAEFQKIIDEPISKARFEKLSSLANDFCYAAKQYGKIIISFQHLEGKFFLPSFRSIALVSLTKQISLTEPLILILFMHISEKYLPEQEKTIRPMHVGGFAGGIKYCTQGILFKFAVDIPSSKNDRPWTYGGASADDHAAAKIAGHELKGAVSYFNASSVADKLRFPFQVIIDYRGFRLIAMPLLPVDDTTIVYGSFDGGKNAFASNKEFNEQMRLAGEYLHIKPHQVGSTTTQTLHSCGDIERHLGKDGRMYLLDFSRSTPPEYQKDGSGSFDHLFRRLRPELLQSIGQLYNVSLNPDALTSFCADKAEKEKAKQELIDATNVYLFSGSIPAMADKLVKWPDALVEHPDFFLDCEMHRLGVNMRHLGRVRAKIPETQFTQGKRMLVLREIIARTAKNTLRHLLRSKMAEIRIPSSEPYLAAAVGYYNTLLSDKAYWTDPNQLKKQIEHYYPSALTPAELASDYALNTNMDFYKLFDRIQKLSGVKLIAIAREQLRVANWGNPGILLVKSDIRKMSVNVKTISLMNYAKAKVLYFAAELSLCQQSTRQAERLFVLANKHFRAAHASNTLNTDILYTWGDCELAQSHLLSDALAAEKLRSAERRFRRCTKLSGRSFTAMFADATVLLKLGSIVADEAKRSHYTSKAFRLMGELYKLEPDFAYGKIRQKALSLYHELPSHIVSEAPQPDMMEFMFINPIIYGPPEKAGNDWVSVDVTFSHTLLWHRVSLTLRRSVATMARTAEILARWALFRDYHKLPGARDLYARAAQILEILLGWHAIKFTDGQRAFVVRKQDKTVLSDTLRGSTSFYSVQAEGNKPEEFGVNKFRRIILVLQHAGQYSLERFRSLFTTEHAAPFRLSDTTHLFLDVDCGVFILKRFRCVLHSLIPNVSTQDEAFKVWLVFLSDRPTKEDQQLLSSHTEAQLAFIQQKTASFSIRNEKDQTIKLNPFEAKGKWLYVRLVPTKSPCSIEELSFIGRVTMGRSSPISPEKRPAHNAIISVGPASPRTVKEVVGSPSSSASTSSIIAGDVVPVSSITRFFSSNEDLVSLAAVCQSSTLLRQLFSYVLMQRSGMELKSTPSSIHRKKSEAPTISFKPTSPFSLEALSAQRPFSAISTAIKSKSIARTVSGSAFSASLDIEDWKLAPYRTMITESVAQFISSACMLRSLDLRGAQFEESVVRSLIEQARGLVSLNMKGCSYIFQAHNTIANMSPRGSVGSSSQPNLSQPVQVSGSNGSSNSATAGPAIANLHDQFVEFIGKSCPFLAHFAPWETCSEAALLRLVKSGGDQFKHLLHADLSDCTNVSTKVVRKMMKSLQSLNLARTAGDWSNEKTFKKVSKPKSGGGLQGIFLGNCIDVEQPAVDEIPITDSIVLEIIRNNPYLKHIEVIGSTITNTVVLEIASTCKSLQILTLNACDQLTESCLSEVASKTPNLRELHLRGRRGTYAHLSITSTTIAFFSQYWTKLGSVTLSRCLCLADDTSLAAWIKSLAPTLRKLDLAMCSFGDNTAQALAKCTQLVDLQLQGCIIAEKHLTEALKSCKRLQRVGLAGTNASDESLREFLGNQDGSRDGLHTLLLGGCSKVTDVSVRLITQFHSETLRFLDLKLTSVTADSIVPLLSRCPFIQLVDLGNCPRIRDTDTSLILSRIAKTALVVAQKTH